MAKDLSGVLTALITPFYRGEVDYRSFVRLVQHQIADGINGFVINGTTGESPTLKRNEIEKLFEIARSETEGKLPIVVGTGSNSTEAAIEQTLFAGQLGADAALVVVPYYNKPVQKGLLAHFRAVADSSRIPILLYNVPGRTVAGLDVESVEKLSHHPRIVGIKEATGDMQFGSALVEKCGPGFLVTSGDDATFLQLAQRGGKGVISVISHVIGDGIVGLYSRAKRGDETAVAEFEKYRALLELLYCESNPIPVKAALYLMGIIDSPELRLPLTTLSDGPMAKLKALLSEMGKIQ